MKRIVIGLLIMALAPIIFGAVLPAVLLPRLFLPPAPVELGIALVGVTYVVGWVIGPITGLVILLYGIRDWWGQKR